MTSASSATDRYPRAKAVLARLLEARPAPKATEALSSAAFTLGPAILREPPQLARPASAALPRDAEMEGAAADTTEDLLGELVDMVLVSADAEPSGAEVHLAFKADVLGGVHLRLKKTAAGMRATFLVEDAAARRALLTHADDLVAHLRARGFAVLEHSVEIAEGHDVKGRP